MTNEQRESIEVLRRQGNGYTAIAKAIGLSKDSVKAYCRSHGLAGVKAESNARVTISVDICLNCGKPLTQRPKVKKKKFCCPACREVWWNSHQNQVNQKAVYHYTCPTCGKEFTAYGNSHRKYCSHECYITARFKGGDSL
ncbi:MAG: helix-turn-helix domain-containing protein [Clostridiales bacterium]|nr:helix-turn-helix domain-containing protein [Clostridiales bacterium]